MEAEWERGQREPELGLGAINALLGPANRCAVSATRVSEGRASSVYLLGSADGERWVLRFHRSVAAANLEAALTASLPPGAMAPAILAKDPGGAWALLELCPGKTMERLATEGRMDELVAAAPSIGRALAVISSKRFPAAGFLNERLEVSDPWPATFEGLNGYALHCLGSSVTQARLPAGWDERVSRQLIESGSWMPPLLGPPCLVHGDYKAGNLMIYEGSLSGVLDWEFAHSGTWLFSVAQVLRFEHELPPEFANGLVAGLEDAGMELHPQWRRASLTLDLLSLLDFLARPGSTTSVIAGVLDLLGRALVRLESD